MIQHRRTLHRAYIVKDILFDDKLSFRAHCHQHYNNYIANHLLSFDVRLTRGFKRLKVSCSFLLFSSLLL